MNGLERRIFLSFAAVGMLLCAGCRTPSVEAGAVTFRKNCATCHAPQPGQRREAPSLAGYFSHNPAPSFRETKKLIENGRRSMPPFRKRLSSNQIDDVIAFLKTQ